MTIGMNWRIKLFLMKSSFVATVVKRFTKSLGVTLQDNKDNTENMILWTQKHSLKLLEFQEGVTAIFSITISRFHYSF